MPCPCAVPCFFVGPSRRFLRARIFGAFWRTRRIWRTRLAHRAFSAHTRIFGAFLAHTRIPPKNARVRQRRTRAHAHTLAHLAHTNRHPDHDPLPDHHKNFPQKVPTDSFSGSGLKIRGEEGGGIAGVNGPWEGLCEARIPIGGRLAVPGGARNRFVSSSAESVTEGAGPVWLRHWASGSTRPGGHPMPSAAWAAIARDRPSPSIISPLSSELSPTPPRTWASHAHTPVRVPRRCHSGKSVRPLSG
jgi:hypothetical protein